MTRGQWIEAGIKIRQHYGLDHPATLQEIEAEILNIIRRGKDNLPDSLERLRNVLQAPPCGIDFD